MIHPKPGQTLPPPLDNLQNTHPDWSIWTSHGDGGFASRCYATRLTPLTDDQIGRGLAMTVQSKTPEGLTSLLAKQAELAHTLAGRERLA